MPEKMTAAEGLLNLTRKSGVLSGIFGRIREISQEADIWIFDAQQNKWFRMEHNNSRPLLAFPEVSDMRWVTFQAADGTKPAAHIIVGQHHIMAVSVSVYSKGTYKGEVAAAPLYSGYGAFRIFAEKDADCRLLYDPRLARIFEQPAEEDLARDSGTLMPSLIYLMLGVRRYLESYLRRRNVQMESDIVKSNYAGAEQEFQEMGALADSIREKQIMSSPGDEVLDYFIKMQHRIFPEDANSDAARMEQDLMRMRHILAKWQNRICPVRKEIEFVSLYLRMQRKMQCRRIGTEFRVQKDCLDLDIPFGTIQVLTELSADNFPAFFRKEGVLSLYVRRDGDFCRISYSDKTLVLPEERVRELMNLRYVSEWHYMISILQQEKLPAIDRMILNMQAIYQDSFSADIVSSEQSGTSIQLRYRCV